MNRVIGIDPGKKGAVVVIAESGSVEKYVMPCIGKEFDIHALDRIFFHIFHDKTCHAFIEDVHAIFGSAAGATFQFGYVCGAIRGLVVGGEAPYTLVQPKAWQKVIYQGIPEIRKPPVKITTGKRAGQMMKGKLDTKKMSLVAAKRLFPNVDLRKSERCKIPHEGIVDALLICEYGRRLLK